MKKITKLKLKELMKNKTFIIFAILFVVFIGILIGIVAMILCVISHMYVY